MNLKKIGKVFTSKFVGTGPSSYKKCIYRAAVSQRLRNTDVHDSRIRNFRRNAVVMKVNDVAIITFKKAHLFFSGMKGQ